MNAVTPQESSGLAAQSSASRAAWVGGAALCLLHAASWVHTTRYQGMGDDAQLYAVQALSRLHPEALTHDVFLQFDSQDRYTVFSPIYAVFIDKLGLSASAAFLTLLLHAVSLVALWFIARSFANRALATLAVGLAIVIPGSYGAGDVFQYRESFLTARLAAEASGLIAIALWLHDRRWGATIAAFVTTLLHPLVAAPILALGALSLCHTLRVRRAVLVGGLGLGVLAVLAALALAGKLSPITGEWLTMLRARNDYMFPSTWSLADWGMNALSLVSLVLGALVLPEKRGRLFALALVVIGGAGITISALAGDLLPLEIVTQVQPWRWIWIAKLMGIALLPATVVAVWHEGGAARCSAALLAIAWGVSGTGGAAIAAAAFSLWLGRRKVPTRSAIAATCAIALGAVLDLLIFAHAVFTTPSTRMLDSWFVERLIDLTAHTGLLMAIMWACWLLAIARPRPGGVIIVATLALITLANRAPAAWLDWTRDPYPPSMQERFTDWREIIPPDANVLWIENPAAVWFLLNRASYVSQTQSAGIVFSEQTALEIHRRALALRSFADPQWLIDFGASLRPGEEPVHPLTTSVLRSICADPALGFVVDGANLPGAVATLTSSGPWQGHHLYSCSSFREQG